jgi:omega-hydroxy-beta-dihydromenaquinone-9 sulfotransferase
MAVKLKHRWSISHNYLSGITFDAWWRLLRENRFAVDAAYWHRAAFVTLVSLLNSYYRHEEERLYRDAIEGVEIARPPLFILGHWRSGTTLLHYLLAQDTNQFAFANTYQVVNPYTFLSTEEVNSRRFAGLVPKTRPMDAMRLGFDTPQEDEFAPLLMTLYSLYLGITFPRHEEQYGRYLTFEGVPQSEVKQWQEAFLWFSKKLTLKYGRRLLFKSPPHTARIRLLLEMFPEARFVHIHRDPYRVFQSQRHYFDTATWYTYLQRPNTEQIDDGILRRYTALYDAFFADKSLIPTGHFCEVRFEDLETDPVNQVAQIYSALCLPGFDACRPKLQSYLASLAGYRKNDYKPLDDIRRDRVACEWARSFDTWNYAR